MAARRGRSDGEATAKRRRSTAKDGEGRSAALGLAWQQRWGGRELACWLIGPYAHAAAATLTLRRSGARRALAHRPLDEATISELLTANHAELRAVMRDPRTWSSSAASIRGHVTERIVAGIADDAPGIGYASVDGIRMRLLDRVRSLFVADDLTRPADCGAFAVCDACGGVALDDGPYHAACGHVARAWRAGHAVHAAHTAADSCADGS